MGEVEKGEIMSNPILLITLPKSGSVYISSALEEGWEQPLGKHMFSANVFMSDVVRFQELAKFSRNERGICQNHLPASNLNLRSLDRYLDRWVVHIRDPRQATLSWWHHIRKRHEEKSDLLLQVDHGHFDEERFFNGLNDQEQLDYLIDHHLPACVQWIDEWLEAAQTRKILITTYDEFVENPEEFFGVILAFFDHTVYNFKQPEPPKKGKKHYRSGTKDEFRTVFTKRQNETAFLNIHDHIVDRFGWEL